MIFGGSTKGETVVQDREVAEVDYVNKMSIVK